MINWIDIKTQIPLLVGDYVVWVQAEECHIPTKYRGQILLWNGESFQTYTDARIRVYTDTITHWAEIDPAPGPVGAWTVRSEPLPASPAAAEP